MRAPDVTAETYARVNVSDFGEAMLRGILIQFFYCGFIILNV